ncbi:hypothetical protein BpHYR1_031906 [Brachionus plicatilis]|uniref:Uncharacterized protein n=1 Tax=Brachionus plicatilis TaxID=10195 RepID=A0A3M7R9Z2_BRAPC|nr:hypothetical protein BpHYR1_031906 [Brachionus plicatilis]
MRTKEPGPFQELGYDEEEEEAPNSFTSQGGICFKLKFSKTYVDQLEQMEGQRYDEDSHKELVDSDYEKLAPSKGYLELFRNIIVRVDRHETDSGWCLFLCV